jgi:hypothetical protein
MMSWQRPENINRILAAYQEYQNIEEIIIWNNNAQFYVSNLNLSKVKVINCSNDFGLNTRFMGALLAINRCIIVNDDDLLLSESNINNLIKHFENDYTRIYSYEGRIPQDGQYTCAIGPGRIEDIDKPTEVEIALTRATCLDRLYAAEYFKWVDVVFYDVNINLYGEDIMMSYLASHLSGKKPLVLPIPDKAGYIELPSSLDIKLSTRPNFIEQRTNLIKRCKILFPLPQYPSVDSNKIVFFGNGFYPCAYYQDSFVINSNYKKLLAKDDLNGIKYLSCQTTDKYDWTIFYIDMNINVMDNDTLIIKGLYRDRLIYTDLEINFLTEEGEVNTSRIRLDIGADFVSETRLRLKDYFDLSSREVMLTSIKFILYTKSLPPTELCLTEISVEKQNGK